MILIRRTRPDEYLKKFREYCKNRFQDNLISIVLFGSYVLGYFNKKESDYDIMIILKEPMEDVEKEKKKIISKFPKISPQYILSQEETERRTHLGHFTTYITILKTGKTIYAKREYKKLLKKIKKINLFSKLIDVSAIALKTDWEISVLKRTKQNYKAIKWAVPAIRKRIQLITYIRFNKLIWSLKKNLKKNKDILSNKERKFIEYLDKKMKSRSTIFPKEEKQKTVRILQKVRNELVIHLTDLMK